MIVVLLHLLYYIISTVRNKKAFLVIVIFEYPKYDQKRNLVKYDILTDNMTKKVI